MKYFNKIMLMLLLVSVSFACENFDLELQQDPNAITPENASVNDLYNSVQLQMPNIFLGLQFAPGAAARMYHAGAFSYPAWTTPNTFNGAWTNVYADLFPDVDALIALAEPNGFDVHAGTAKIMKAYVMMAMVDVFGNIPYSEAGQGVEIISPNVDQGSDVYAAAVALLQEATTQLTGTVAAAPAYDNFYSTHEDASNVSKWITLANTLRLRAAVNTGDAGTINSIVAGGDIIDTADEDWQFNAGSQRTNPDSRHPFYANHYEVGDGNYLSNYYMWLLATDKGSLDPRIRYYFYRKVDDGDGQDATTYSCHHTALPTQDAGSNLDHWDAVDPNLRDSYCAATVAGYEGLSGRDHLNGSGIPPDGPIRTSYGLFPFGGDFDNDEFEDTRNAGTTGGGGAGIIPLMMSYQVDLLIAEAILSLGATGDAQTYLESGVRKSMAKTISFESLVETKMTSTEEVATGPGMTEDQTVRMIYGTSDADVDAYVAALGTAFSGAAGTTQLDMVIKENYIASWGNGLEAYNMYRRTGYPSNMQPALESEPGQFPNSFFYPADFVTRNSSVEQKTLADLVFWANGSLGLY